MPKLTIDWIAGVVEPEEKEEKQEQGPIETFINETISEVSQGGAAAKKAPQTLEDALGQLKPGKFIDYYLKHPQQVTQEAVENMIAQLPQHGSSAEIKQLLMKKQKQLPQIILDFLNAVKKNGVAVPEKCRKDFKEFNNLITNFQCIFQFLIWHASYSL